MSAAAASLRRLLAVSPPPIEGDDLDRLILQFAGVSRDRDGVIAGLAPMTLVDDEDRAAWAEVAARDAAWRAALQDARLLVAGQLTGARKLVAYGVKSDGARFEEIG